MSKNPDDEYFDAELIITGDSINDVPTVLDYTALDTRSKNTESAVKEMKQENIELKKEMQRMRDEWHALLSEPEKFMAMLNQVEKIRKVCIRTSLLLH